MPEENDSYKRLLELHEQSEERRSQEESLVIPLGSGTNRLKIHEERPATFTEADAQALLEQDLTERGESS